jgi:hypothetical protein
MAAEGLKPTPFDHQKCWFLGGNVSISRVARSKKVLSVAMLEVQIGVREFVGRSRELGRLFLSLGFLCWGRLPLPHHHGNTFIQKSNTRCLI